jgi:hypothetical protein
VVSGHQSSGKGTRGRTWVSGQGNLFLTVVLKVSAISTPLTLFPLRYELSNRLNHRVIYIMCFILPLAKYHCMIYSMLMVPTSFLTSIFILFS